MPVTSQSSARTRAFARVIGPWLMIVPSIIAVRAPHLGALAAGFFDLPVIAWATGALLLFSGLVIIAFHQYWSGGAAIVISLFGWFLALRGFALMAVPDLMARAVAGSAGSTWLVQIGFGLLALVGLWLTCVGWRREPILCQ